MRARSCSGSAAALASRLEQTVHVGLAQHPTGLRHRRPAASDQLHDARRCERRQLRQALQRRPGRRFTLHFRGESSPPAANRRSSEPSQGSRAVAPLAARAGLEHLAAGDRPWRRRQAQYHVLARRQRHGLDAVELRKAGLARLAARLDPASAGERPSRACRTSRAVSSRSSEPGRLPRHAADIVSHSDIASVSGAASAMPRFSSAISTSRKFNATRWPGAAAATRAPWTSTARTRTGRRSGHNSSVSPAETLAPRRVPVTTGPCPTMLNARSMGRNGTPSPARGRCSRASAASA